MKKNNKKNKFNCNKNKLLKNQMKIPNKLKKFQLPLLKNNQKKNYNKIVKFKCLNKIKSYLPIKMSRIKSEIYKISSKD